jgi:hypothetical protein
VFGDSVKVEEATRSGAGFGGIGGDRTLVVDGSALPSSSPGDGGACKNSWMVPISDSCSWMSLFDGSTGSSRPVSVVAVFISSADVIVFDVELAPSDKTEVVVVLLAQSDGGLLDKVHNPSRIQSWNALTLVYTAGALGRPQPFPNDTMPICFPS